MPSIERDGRPSALIWLLAVASVLLPVVGVGLALYGLVHLFRGDVYGYAWLFAGLVILVADLVADTRWNVWGLSREPGLNRRGDRIVGEVVTVVEPIVGGARGTVRAGDTVWQAEGADASHGAKVRVTACNGTVLTVSPV